MAELKAGSTIGGHLAWHSNNSNLSTVPWAAGTLTLGDSTGVQGILKLYGSTAGKLSNIKCTSGNLHMYADDTSAIYLNYYTGTGGIIFGNGAGGSSGAGVSAGGIMTATRFTSTQATGTAPFTVASTTKVTNLNVDRLDDLSAANFLRSDAADEKTSGNLGLYDNIYLQFGTGNDTEMFWSGSHFYTDINGGANWYVRDGNSSNATRFTFDIDVGLLTGTRFASTQATGTAPFTVASTTKVTNLNVDRLDDRTASDFVRSNATDSVSGALTHTGNYYRFNDNIELYFGTSTSQSHIYSDGSNSRWKLVSGSLYIMDNGTNRFTFARTTGYLTAADFLLSSDETLKTNIKDLNVTELVVNYREFEFKDVRDHVRFGVIAQELEKNHPELVRENEENGKKSVSYNDLFVREIAYLKKEKSDLRTRVTELENKNTDLENRLAKLEKLLLK